MFNYKSTKWKHKQKAILRRDGYMCQWCKRYGKQVSATTVHHIKHADEYPELAYTDSNLISLCSGCHNKAHPEKAAKDKRILIMNAQEFKAHMQLISVQAREDIEAAHIEADDLLCNQLSELGYTEGIKIFQSMEKYYA